MYRAYAVNRPAPSWGRRLLTGAVGLVIAVATLVFFEMLFGQVSGTEFAPGQFQRRSFVFFQVPWVQLQISPVFRDNITNDLEDHLRRKRLITTLGNGNRWDVVSLTAGAQPTDGQCRILCRYLDEEDEQDELRWLEWSRKHPDLAKPFWPAVQQAAVLEAYCLVPELFNLAASAKSPDAFARQLDDWLTQSYEELGDDYRESGQSDDAAKYYSAALERSPENQALRKKCEAHLPGSQRDNSH